MPDPIPVRSPDEAAARAEELADRGGRVLLGLVGAPGSGKSTLARRLATRLGPDRARVVPMDGFHLAGSELARLGRQERKGAPDTFDATGFLVLLARLRAAADDVVYAPEFRRDIEEPVASAIPVPRAVPLVVVEGNYLLLDGRGWDPVAGLLDEAWYVVTDEATRHRRLVERHMAHGRTRDEARAWALGSDERNAQLIEATRSRADAVVDLDRAGDGLLGVREETLGALGARLPVPRYDRSAVRVGVVHLGVGGFHRAHQAMFHDRLLAEGDGDAWGICGVGALPGDRHMTEVLDAQDGLYTLVVKHADGSYEARVIGALVEHLLAPDDPGRVAERLADPDVRIASLTITEGGYDVGGRAGTAAFDLLVEGLRLRRARGIPPFTVLSCDNLPGNGAAARAALGAVAARTDPDLAAWIDREVAFPSSMVDRITPQTTDADRAELRDRLGVEDLWPVVCEPFAQWVVEDDFPAGRPHYGRAGVRLVADVAPYEELKVRMLNGGHQALGQLGRLLGLTFAHEASEDPDLHAFVLGYMVDEVLPTLAPVPDVDVAAYARTLLARFANPHVRDTLARLCEHASDRIPAFVLPVVRAQLAQGGPVTRAATVVAAWALALDRGTDDLGGPLELGDPLAGRLAEAVRAGTLLEQEDVLGAVGADERFAAAVATALAALREDGTRAVLRAAAPGAERRRASA